MKITWLGTAAIRLEADGETVLFDPFVQLVGGENPNCLDDFLQDQTICVTHGHLDHLMEVPEFLDPESDAEATVYCGEVAAFRYGGEYQQRSKGETGRRDPTRGRTDSCNGRKACEAWKKSGIPEAVFPQIFAVFQKCAGTCIFESEISGGRTDADVRGACGG